MNPLDQFAIETRVIVRVLWGLLLIAFFGILSLLVENGLLRWTAKTNRRRQSTVTRTNLKVSASNATLQAALAALEADNLELMQKAVAQAATIADYEDGIPALKETVRHHMEVRAKTEDRLVKQNAELDLLRRMVDTIDIPMLDESVKPKPK